MLVAVNELPPAHCLDIVILDPLLSLDPGVFSLSPIIICKTTCHNVYGFYKSFPKSLIKFNLHACLSFRQ